MSESALALWCLLVGFTVGFMVRPMLDKAATAFFKWKYRKPSQADTTGIIGLTLNECLDCEWNVPEPHDVFGPIYKWGPHGLYVRGHQDGYVTWTLLNQRKQAEAVRDLRESA